MCKCTPEIRTPFCGKPGCTWPEQKETKMKHKPGCYFIKLGQDGETTIGRYYDGDDTWQILGYSGPLKHKSLNELIVLGRVNPEMIKIEREEGFYKVKFKSTAVWGIARYVDCNWFIAGWSDRYKDHHFSKIGDKIELPE